MSGIQDKIAQHKRQIEKLASTADILYQARIICQDSGVSVKECMPLITTEGKYRDMIEGHYQTIETLKQMQRI